MQITMHLQRKTVSFCDGAWWIVTLVLYSVLLLKFVQGEACDQTHYITDKQNVSNRAEPKGG